MFWLYNVYKNSSNQIIQEIFVYSENSQYLPFQMNIVMILNSLRP